MPYFCHNWWFIYVVAIKLFIFLVLFFGFYQTIDAKTIAQSERSTKVINQVSPLLKTDLLSVGLQLGDPVFLRIIKSGAPSAGVLSDGIIEIYIGRVDGEYLLYKTRKICAASGVQGPKIKYGDGQSPEGFYYLTGDRLNPWSSYHLSLNLGYPNTYDRKKGRTGDYLMIHGNCVSMGCYAMTDAGIEEIYTLVYAAMKNGQDVVRVHSFPFPMTDTNMAKTQGNPNHEFWKNLKQGWDWFETHAAPPDVNVKDGAYVFQYLPTP